MDTKQISMLAALALVALVGAVVFRPHAPAPTTDFGLKEALTTTSPITPIDASNSSIAEQARVQSRANESIAPRAPARHTVHMKIVAPDGTSEFDVDLREGEDLCENIQEAKSEGHIRSLTMDNSYADTFGSQYVREINGYSNNWTVEVNGTKPLGCSLYKPQEGDAIVWTFGELHD